MKKIIVILIVTLLLISCRTSTKIVEVPVEVVKKEYICNTKIDSVYIKDSIDRWQKGDTLYITKYSIKYKYVNKTDTLVKIDSIPKVITVEKEKRVETNHIYWWQKVLMWLGGIMIMLTAGFITYKVKIK